jgi:hypothetical protein
MSLPSTSIRRPTNPVPKSFVPPGGRPHKVTDKDSWASLANSLFMKPWDLIRYNYPGLPVDEQMAAREVNWYLEQYVGCTKSTDHRNYAFSSDANPGQIWLPPAPKPDRLGDPQKEFILQTLRRPSIQRMNIRVGSVVILPRDYEAIAKAIEGGFIQIVVDPTLVTLAFYNHVKEPPKIIVGPNFHDEGLAVHECTHAIFDLQRRTTNMVESEAVGYIAQSMFAIATYGPQPRYIPDRTNRSYASWQLIFDEARRLAQMQLAGQPVTNSDLAGFDRALSTNPTYSSRYRLVERNPGLTVFDFDQAVHSVR